MSFTLATGAYTPADAARVLGVKPQRIANLAWRHWWGDGYSELGDVRSLDFYTLMELRTYLALREAGVSGQRIHKARRELIEDFRLERPFANRRVLEGLRTDGSTIYFEVDGRPLSLNGTKQFNLEVIRSFMSDVDFGEDGLAERYTPSRGQGSVVLDPRINLGRPVVRGTRIEAAVLAQMHKAGDSIELIADAYDLDVEDVEHAIDYAMAA